MRTGLNGSFVATFNHCMDNNERRRDVRAYASPIAHIMRRSGAERIEVLNASYRGLFFRCQAGEAPPLNQLLHIRLELSSRSVDLNGTAIRIVPDAQGRLGVGVRFFCLIGEDKGHWESYITSLLSPGRRAAA